MQQGTNAGAVSWPVLGGCDHYYQEQSKKKDKHTGDAREEATDYAGRKCLIWVWVAMEVGGWILPLFVL